MPGAGIRRRLQECVDRGKLWKYNVLGEKVTELARRMWTAVVGGFRKGSVDKGTVSTGSCRPSPAIH